MNNGFRLRPTTLRIWMCLLALAGVAAPIGADDSEIMQRRRQQQATVDIARQLVVEVLDIQIQQLTENSLGAIPIFFDIQRMRSNIDNVTEEDMHEIIDLLNHAERSSHPKQVELIGQARNKAREVVAVLIAEREQLRQRLKVAHLQAQLRVLIAQQQRVRADTEQLHAAASGERDLATMSALEDQRDAHILFRQLTESLGTAKKWDGTESSAAAKSIEHLRNGEVDQLFVDAESNLAKGAIDHAVKTQGHIVEQLLAALDKLEAAQGLEPFDHSATLAEVQKLLQDQQQLSDETREVDAQDFNTLDQLSQRQKEVHQQLGELVASGAQLAGGKQHAQQAQAAARAAEADLFEGNRDAALNRQSDVIRNLEQLADLLIATAPTSSSPNTGDSPGQQVTQPQTPRSGTQQARSGDGSQATPKKSADKSDSATTSTVSRRDKPPPSDAQYTDALAESSRRTVGDAQRRDDDRGAIGGRPSFDAPWFARLPPELREAIRVQGRRQPPRGYEERLRRYFESVDANPIVEGN